MERESKIFRRRENEWQYIERNERRRAATSRNEGVKLVDTLFQLYYKLGSVLAAVRRAWNLNNTAPLQYSRARLELVKNGYGGVKVIGRKSPGLVSLYIAVCFSPAK